MSRETPKSIEDVKALLRPAQQQPLPPEHEQISGLEYQFLDMVEDLIRNYYSRNRLVELINQQYQQIQASNASKNDLDNDDDGQQFGLSYGGDPRIESY